MMMERGRLDEALATLGELLGVVERPTADIDVVGYPSAVGYVKVDVLPDFLLTAVRDLGKAARWTRTHDPSDGFLRELQRILALLDVEISDADLSIP